MVAQIFEINGENEYPEKKNCGGGGARGLGCLLGNMFNAVFPCWCPHSSSPTTQQTNARQSELSLLMTDSL